MDTYTILCVDDEKNILNSLKRLLRNENYKILTAGSAKEGLKKLETTKVDLVLSDQRMQEISGVEFLSRVKELFPDVIRIILSGYTEVNTITAAINEGNVYKFILKPWNDEELKITIRHSLDHYELLQENKKLYLRIREQNEVLKDLNQKLEQKVEERTQELLVQNQALKLTHEILDNLPFAVMGISDDGMVAFINKEGQHIYGDEVGSVLTLNIEEVLSKKIVELVKDVLTLDQKKNINSYSINKRMLEINCLPLAGQYRGVILTAIEEKKDEYIRL